MPEPEIEAIRRIYDAFSRWDIDDLAMDVTHDFELNMPETVPWGGTFHGGDGVRAFATVFRDHVVGQWADPDDYIDGGDVVVVLGRLRGRVIATGRGVRGALRARLDAVRWNAGDRVAATSTPRRSWRP